MQGTARSPRLKPSRGQSQRLPIYYLGRANHHCGQQALTFSIGPARWDYWLPTQKAESAEYLARKVGPAKALAYAKRHSTAQVRQ